MRASSTGARQQLLPGFDLFAALLATESPITTTGAASAPAQFQTTTLIQGEVAANDADTGLRPVEGPNVIVDETAETAVENDNDNVLDPIDAAVVVEATIASTLEIDEGDPLFKPAALIRPYDRVDAVTRNLAPWLPLATNALADTLSGPVAKFEANMAAIELLRQLETDNRLPDDAERLTLQRYTGWGGLKEVFEPRPLPEWQARKARLEAALTAEELESARGSVVNAHYTDLPIVQAMWTGLKTLGFKGGRILEPALGVGHFFGVMPQEIAACSQMHATELDNLSARIATKLYGHAATIHRAGFETVEYPEAWFDLAVSNVPFGNYTVPCHRKKPYSKKSIHNYFLARALDLVRPGGIVAIITSTFFMDATSDSFRRYVASKAKLLGAIRLPRKAFAKIASTDVSTDILFLQRRGVGELPDGSEDPWLDCKALPASSCDGMSSNPGFDTRKNVYWAHRPEMVVGRWTAVRGAYNRSAGGELVAEYSGEDLGAEVQQRAALLPKDAYTSATQSSHAYTIEPAGEVASGLREGEFVVRNGHLMQCVEGMLRPFGQSGKALLRASGMHAIRQQVRALLDAQMDPSVSDAQLQTLRGELNRTYDAFVAQHGCVSSRSNVRVFRSDPDWPLLLSLEIYDEEGDTAEKAAIFTTRTGQPSNAPTKAESPEDALAISVAEAGHVNPSYIGQLLGVDPDEAMAELVEDGHLFVNPETGRYETAGEYLSGHIMKKLAVAQHAGESYARNVVALERARPEDLKPHEIDARLGVGWIPTADYEDFIKHLAGDEWQRYHSVSVERESATGAWAVKGSVGHLACMSTSWGTKDVSGVEIINRALNGQMITVRDPVEADNGVRYVVNVVKTAAAREKQAKIEERFSAWLWEDDARAQRLLRVYNDTYNTFVERKYDGSKMRLPGYSWALAPSAHQLNAAARIASGNNTLLAHVVGAGKTLTMIMGSMELRRLGLARKPCHAVPNHMLLQYTAEFMRAYPSAKVLMASKDDLAKDRRKAFMARAATGDWDAIVMTHSSFEKLSADPDIAQSLIDSWLAEIDEALKSRSKSKEERSIVKQLVKMEKEWKARLERMQAQWKKDDFLTMSMLGIDAVMVDEGHLFKNLFRFSQMERIAGLPNSSSQRAFDMLVKTQQIMAQHGDKERGIVMATGTPVANSMAELHVMQRFLQPKTLERMGLAQFDSWAAQFGRAVTSLEVAPDGSSFRMNTRFAQFVNMPELMGMFGQVADIQTKAMLKLPTPALVGGGAQVISVKPSEALKKYIAGLVERAERIRNREVTPDQDNMLAVTNDGRKAALDVRLVLGGAERDAEGKVAACVDKVHELWLKTMDTRGTQLVFSDLGTPGKRQFSIYEDIRDHLVLKGVPASQIAFIHDCATDRAKDQLFAKVREGSVRVLLGSTQKMGMGTNVQKRLYALHHLDAPWRPADVEQREGRIERRGNDCEFVEIWRYVTEGSFDAYMWQGLAAKARFIAQVMSGDRSVRRIEDAEMSALSYEEVKAIACGNPAVKEKAQLDAEYRKLCMLKSHARDSQWAAREQLRQLPDRIGRATRDLEAARKDVEVVRKHGVEDLVVEGQTLTDPKAIADALAVMSKAEREAMHRAPFEAIMCVYAGLPLRVVGALYREEWGMFRFELGDSLRMEVRPFLVGARLHAELAARIGELDSFVERKQAQIGQMQAQKPLLERQASSVFEHADRLEAVSQRLRELDIELGLVKDMDGSAALDETSVVANHTSLTAADAAAAQDQQEEAELAAE